MVLEIQFVCFHLLLWKTFGFIDFHSKLKKTPGFLRFSFIARQR